MKRTLLLSTTAVLALSACSSGGSSVSRGPASYSDSTSPSPRSASAVPGLSPAAAPRSPAAQSPGAVATTAAPGVSARATTGGGAPTARAADQGAAARRGGASAPATARPGTYTRDTTGTVTLGSPGTPQDAGGSGTLTISPAVNGVQHTKAHDDQGDTEQDVVFRSNGVYASRLTLTTKAFTKDFRPSPAVLLLPQPTTGRWSWRTVSTDGKTTITATNAYVRSEILTISGSRVPCVVVQTRLVLSGDVDVTIDLTSWEATALHLVAKEHTKTKGTYSGFAFSSDTTSVLRSTDPS